MNPTPDQHSTILLQIMDILSRISGVPISSPDLDFYDAGVTSVKSLPLLMELEEQFQLAIPDDRFIQVRTPRALGELILNLRDN